MNWWLRDVLYVLAVLGIFAGLVTLAVLVGGWIWYRRVQSMPDNVDVVTGHPIDCACEARCWPAYVQRLREVARQQAAEINDQDTQGRRR